MKLFLNLALALLLAPLAAFAAEPTLPSKPNLVLILADDLGYGDLGCYGAKVIRTPNLDRMAAEGIRFTSFYAQAFCGPSRAALMTGCYPLRLAEVGNKKHLMPVPHARETLLSEVLKRAGYATAQIGKWDLAGHAPDHFEHPANAPLKRGFDRHFGTPASNDQWAKTVMYRDGAIIENPVDLTESTTKRYADEAIRFIRERKGRPFFIYLCPNMPHTALHAGAEFRGRSPRGLYGDVVEELDHHIGRILDTLRAEGIASNTVVLFTSDNGPWLLRKEHGGSAGPLRGGKASNWEGGVRLPAIAWAPGRVAARQTCGRIASTLDLLPTFAKLAGAPLPENKLDGRDLSAWLLQGPPAGEDTATHLYHMATHLQAVRQGRWKLHLPRPMPVPWLHPNLRVAHIAEADLFEIKTPLLYDLDADLGEKTDVAAQHPDVVKRLLALADKARAEIGDYDRIGTEARFFDAGPPRPDLNDWKRELKNAAPETTTPPLAAEGKTAASDVLGTGFQNPPPPARPWAFWFWINGNISKEGITADLESFKRAGVGGVLWMEVSGPWWAPDGKVGALSPQWHDAFQWAVRECERLGLAFDVTLDFGYGSGGPHIMPELSMQRLVWSEQAVDGGQPLSVVLAKPHVEKKVSAWMTPGAQAWLRPGAEISATVRQAIDQLDSYRDVAVVAIALPASPPARAYRIAQLDAKAGLHWKRPAAERTNSPPPPDAVTPVERVIDLTSRMERDGRLTWDAPPGKWLVLRCGHASNFKMTRPCPQAAVGLECDRLSKAGIETHFDAFLKKIIAGAGRAAGGTLAYAHIDSWEAGGQNWTASFPDEFRSRRGYDLRPWLPVLTGRVVGSAELSERFLWDVRTTVSELIRDNYAGRLRELVRAHGMKLSLEAYGQLCIDNLSYAGVSDLPISEFWAMGNETFPAPLPRGGGYEQSSKAMASAAHTYGRPVVGAEAFTSGRGWRDHPYLLKGMGDKAFCRGVNRMILSASVHQPYANMIPGLTHRRWGEQFQRHNTWWDYSRPWTDYLTRCQYLLQQGEFVADVCHWFGEGAPLSVDDMTLEMPAGFDHDLVSSEIVLQMKVRNGRLVLPSGMSYRYLLLPDSDRMTLPLAKKVRELVAGGARVLGGKRPKGAPGLTGFPRCDAEVEQIAAALWDANRVVSGKKLAEVFSQDGLRPDFEGNGLLYIHRRIGAADVYFVSCQQDQPQDIACTFRVAGKAPELWDPETGATRELPDFIEREGRITVPLHFDPMQSWFVVFRKRGGATTAETGKNFASPRPLREITGGWQVTFDPKRGGPNEGVAFEKLTDWSRHPDPRVRYYSGTAVYRKTIELAESEVSAPGGRLWLDLGKVEVMARVRLNGTECGIVWKPPCRVDITGAARPGKNELEIDVVNLWINRMIGDEQLPEDSHWLDFETLAEWPDWFQSGAPRASGRYTFTTAKHYKQDSPLVPSGLLGPVKVQTMVILKGNP